MNLLSMPSFFISKHFRFAAVKQNLHASMSMISRHMFLLLYTLYSAHIACMS